MATAGRILWRLDRRGYTARCGNRGRVLSETGKLRLAEMERLSKREALSREFLGELDAQGPRKLLDMLVARRAVERETARLAALHADGDDLAEIGIFAEILDGRKESDIQAEIIDRRFHEAVARAGKNTLLAAALSLFRQDAELAQVLTNIRRHGKSPLGGYHGPIAAAIAARDPERAEQAMLAHIDAIIEEMRQFFRENPEEGERPAHRRVCAPPARFFHRRKGSTPMKITNIKVGTLEASLKKPFKTALRTVERVESVLVRVETDEGATGYGEAPPRRSSPGDVARGIEGALRDHLAPPLLGGMWRIWKATLPWWTAPWSTTPLPKPLWTWPFMISGPSGGTPLSGVCWEELPAPWRRTAPSASILPRRWPGTPQKRWRKAFTS